MNKSSTEQFKVFEIFNARSMDVFISKLSKKLAGDQGIQILNIRGYGYKLVCKE